MKIVAKLWTGIIVLVILTPLGLIISDHFKAGRAWGEWDAREVQNFLWKAPMSGYAFKEKDFAPGFSYLLSAVAGVVVIVLIVWLIGRLLTKRDD